jgi:DNA-directed RNA polymerase subunit RPC12/RpoP
MICLNCKKQIPDDSDRCPNCGAEVFHKNQVVKEIAVRRWQRWIFYVILIIAFVGAVGIILKIYAMNTKLVSDLAGTQNSLSQRQADLDKAQADLAALQQTQAASQTQNASTTASLNAQITSAQQLVDSLTMTQSQTKSQLDFYNSLVKDSLTAINPITAADLNRIPFADVAYGGTNTDGDGLPDNLEAALGTSATSTDTDGDTYSDRAELVSGHDPLIANASLPIDLNFAAAQKGKLFLDPLGYLWFVGSDAKRYFLGKGE